MLNIIFSHYLKSLKNPTFFFHLNIWIFLNLQIFLKILNNKLVYFIESLSGLKLNLIFIQLKTFSFVYIYINYIIIYILIFFFFLFI